MILKRDEFIKEVYTPMMEDKEYKELQAINEGLLKTIFGKIKDVLGFGGWKSIKGDAEIIKVYKELDDKLTGFTTMKLNKSKQCDKIRQELVDFACDWYDMKMKDAKENDMDPEMEKSMEFEDETLKTSLETCKKNIENIADGDEQMIKWSQLLMQNMKNIINKSILKDIKNEDVKSEIEEQEKEDATNIDEINKEMEKLQNDELKAIVRNRKKLISNTEATPLNDNVMGNKAIENICAEFNKLSPDNKDVRNNRGEDMMKALSSDKLLGLNKMYSSEDASDNKFAYAMFLTKAFYSSLNDKNVMEKFENTSSTSVQAMCIGINAFIKYYIYGGSDFNEYLPIMAKCAIVSNGVASYNLPLNDDKDNPGNFFTDTTKLIVSGKLSKGFVKKMKNTKNIFDEISKNSEFTQNAKTLSNKIKEAAEKEIEKAQKAQKAHDKKVETINKKYSKKSED